MKIKIFKSKRNGQWYFKLVARNGEKIAQSEGYTRKEKCVKTATAIKSAKIEIIEPSKTK